jgi:hypothetical protein
MFGACQREAEVPLHRFETGWLAHYLMRLDEVTKRKRRQGDATARCVWRTPPALLAKLVGDVRMMNASDTRHHRRRNMMWGNDYPHGDAVF